MGIGVWINYQWPGEGVRLRHLRRHHVRHLDLDDDPGQPHPLPRARSTRASCRSPPSRRPAAASSAGSRSLFLGHRHRADRAIDKDARVSLYVRRRLGASVLGVSAALVLQGAATREIAERREREQPRRSDRPGRPADRQYPAGPRATARVQHAGRPYHPRYGTGPSAYPGAMLTITQALHDQIVAHAAPGPPRRGVRRRRGPGGQRPPRALHPDAERRPLAHVLRVRLGRPAQALPRDGRPRRGAGGHLPLAHRHRGLPLPHRHLATRTSPARTTSSSPPPTPTTPGPSSSARSGSWTARSPRKRSRSSRRTRSRVPSLRSYGPNRPHREISIPGPGPGIDTMSPWLSTT